MALNTLLSMGPSSDKITLMSGVFTSTIKSSTGDIVAAGFMADAEFDGTNTLWADQTGQQLMLQSGNQTSTIKTSQVVAAVNVRGISSDSRPGSSSNTLWAEDTNDKLLLTSGQFTGTIKTSVDVSVIDIVPLGISTDGTDTLWSGFNDDKIHKTSGIFSSTIKTSISAPDPEPWGISTDGTDTYSMSNNSERAFLHSGKVTATIKTSRSYNGYGSAIHGIGTDDINGRLGSLLVDGTGTITIEQVTINGVGSIPIAGTGSIPLNEIILSGVGETSHKSGTGTPAISDVTVSGVSTVDLRTLTLTLSSTEIEDNANNLGAYNRITLNTSGNPHIVYRDDTDDTIKHASYDGTSWSTEIIEPNADSSTTSLGLDVHSNDHIHVAYLSAFGINESLTHGHYDGTSWNLSAIGTPGSVTPNHPSLVVDTSGTIHVSFVKDGLMGYAKKEEGGSWSISTISATGVLLNDIAVDSLGQPHIVFRNNPLAHLNYLKWNGVSWEDTIISASNFANQVSISVDSSDKPHIAYYDDARNALGYAKYNGSSWDVEIVADNGSFVGQRPAIDITSAGVPYITYIDGDGTDTFKVAVKNVNRWTTSAIGQVGTLVYSDVVIDFDTGEGHISYNNDNDDSINYATLNVGGLPTTLSGAGAISTVNNIEISAVTLQGAELYPTITFSLTENQTISYNSNPVVVSATVSHHNTITSADLSMNSVGTFTGNHVQTSDTEFIVEIQCNRTGQLSLTATGNV